MTETVSLTKPVPHVLVVTIDRPARRNAVDRDTAAALFRAFSDFDSDPELRVAVLTGSEGYFCAGADLSKLDHQLNSDMSAPGPMGPSRMELSKPVIAAVEGHAVAGGLELAAWCDLRVAATTARFGVLCRLRGVPLIDGGTVRLPALIGLSHASDLILTGRVVQADEAHRMGLVNIVTPHGQALPTAIQLASTIASHPQTCMRNDRRSMRAAIATPSDLEREFTLGLDSLAALATEGAVNAFLSRSGKAKL